MASKRRVCWKADSELEEVKIFTDDEGPPAKKPFIGFEPFGGVSNGKLEKNHSTHSQDEALRALHKSSSDESVIESPPGDDDVHSKTSTKMPESIIKKRLCPHRQYGCLFETTAEESNSLEEHLHSEPGCIFEKFKLVIQNKENQVLDLKQQLKQMKIDMMLRIHNLEQQLFLLSSNTMQLATKFQMQENQRQQTQIRTDAKPLPIDPKYIKNPFKLSAQLVTTLEGHKQIVTSLVTNDFTMFTGSGDATQQGSLKKWNLTSFAIQDSTDDGVVFSLIIHESKLICGSMNHIKVRDLETLEIFSRLEGHRGEVKSLIVAGARLISGAVDGYVKVWDLDSYQCLLSVKAHDSQVIGIEASIADQQLEYLFTASHDSTIKMWSQTFQLIHTFKGHVGPIKSLVRIDQFLVSGAEDNLIKIWDWTRRDEIETLTGLPGVTALKSGKLNGIDIFFSGHVNGAILIWDFRSRELLQYIEAHKDRVRAITGFQQLLITASYDKTIKIWQ